jgi:hypothetical protein
VSGRAAAGDSASPAAATFEDTGDILERQVRAAQDELARGVERAGLLRDPYRHLVAAQSATLDVFPAVVRVLHAAIAHAREPVDPASVEKLAHAAAGGAERNAAKLARTHALRTALLAAATLAGAVLVAGIGGYTWGYRSARGETQAVAAGVQQAAFQHGPAAAAAWLGLMVANDPVQALAGCSGSDVKVIGGRRACTVPLWLDPPKAQPPAITR